jgi:hypothetical protein
LPLETGSLAEWLNTGKENGSDEGNEMERDILGKATAYFAKERG